MKKILSFILAILITLTCFVSCDPWSFNEEKPQRECEKTVGLINMDSAIENKTVNFYRNGQTESLNLAFFEDVDDAPMIKVEDMVSVLNSHIQSKRDSKYLLSYSLKGNEVHLTRDNGAYCEIDFKYGSVFFDDYNKFNTLSFKLGSLDILDSDGFNELGEAEYFQRVIYSEKAGESSFIGLHKRGIPTTLRDGQAYVTLQTFSDIFLAPYEVMIAYNGSDCFLLDSSLLGELESVYFSGENKQRSDELIDLNYRQLCLSIDFHYGLKELHGFHSADRYIEQLGLKEAFYSEDPAVCFTALKTLLYNHIADNHSGVLLHSPYNPTPNYSLGENEASVGYREFYKTYQYYYGLRAEQVENGLKAYSEIGDTAFVVFDSFSSATVNYYESSPIDGDFKDEIGLISYAHAMITRENSPIKNVVIDLATNTGGHMDGGIYLVAWVLGNAIMHISDPTRNAESTSMYRADVNLDRVFDEKDTISDKNVYLITSPITFSCANYVASAFKESGRVTILGSTTGGGTSCVYMSSCADGSAICFSSSLRMSSYKNGSYYPIDKGIAPDVKITDSDYIFNYDKLAEIINTLH